MGLFKFILSFFTGLSPKTWLVVFAVLSVLGAFLWFRNSIYQECKSDVKADVDSAKVIALELELSEARQKETFLLDNQRKNEDFIKRQKRALKDANEKDGDVAPNLRGTFERLRNDRTD